MTPLNDVLDQVQEAQKPSEITVVASKINAGLRAFELKKSELLELKKECEGLKITSIEDKETINQVSTFRKKLKAERVEIEKQGKSLRDPLTQISRNISEKEKELTGIIEPVERQLQGQENWVASELEKIALEKQKAEEAVLQARVDKLAAYGYRVDLVLLKSVTDEQFESTLASAKSEYEKEQARVAEEKRIAEEASLQLKKDQEELQKLRDQQAAAQAIIDQENTRIAAEQKEKEEAINAEKRRQEDLAAHLQGQKIYQRQTQLISLGMQWNRNGELFIFEDVQVNNSLELKIFTDATWNALIEKITPAIEEKKTIAAEKKAKELEEKNREIAAKALADKAEADRLLKLQEEEKLNQSSDKVKFQAVAATLVSIKIPTMSSKKMQKMHVDVRGRIDAIVAFINSNI